MPTFTQITSPPQAQAEVIVNEALEALAHTAVYGRNPSTSSGLTWGYFGGAWGGFAIAAATLALTASATNYIVVNRSTGAISASTSPANHTDTASYARLYTVVTGASTVMSVVDERYAPSGVLTASFSSGAVSSVNSRTGAVVVSTCIPIAVSDEATALAIGVAKVTFRMPFAMTGVMVRASLTTAQTSGSIFTVDVNEGGTSILSTKLTIDNTEKTSKTAATPPVISKASLADDAEITIDIDQIGDGTAKGLKVYLIGVV